MKKFVVVMLCAVMACVALAGCGAEKKFLGTWKSVAMEEDGEKYTKDDDEYGEMIASLLTIELEEEGEGTMKVSMFGQTETEDFDWEVDEDDKNTIIMTKDGDDLEAELDDDQLIVDLEGTKVYLELDD